MISQVRQVVLVLVKSLGGRNIAVDESRESRDVGSRTIHRHVVCVLDNGDFIWRGREVCQIKIKQDWGSDRPLWDAGSDIPG